MIANACLIEEGVEGVMSSPNSLVTWHMAISLDAMFQAIDLPAGVADLDTSLANESILLHGSYALEGEGDRSRRQIPSYHSQQLRGAVSHTMRLRSFLKIVTLQIHCLSLIR